MPRETPYDFNNIKHMREQGKSWKAIGQHYNRSKPSVYRWYHKHKAVVKQHVKQQLHQQEEQPAAELIDTTGWSWEKWALLFLGIELEPHQINDLYALDNHLRVIINDPRRHGKTTVVARIFVLRKMCEMVLVQTDVNIIYTSASKDNMVDFSLMIANDLIFNEKIIDNYGLILDDGSTKEMKKLQYKKLKRQTIRQTQFILDIINRKQLFNHTLQVVTIKSSIRGKGAHYVIIDDPVDVFHTNSPDTIRKLTKKIMVYLKEKIYPLAERMIALIGTRYDIEGMDIFTQLAQEGGGRVWKYISRQAIITVGEYSVRETTDEITPADIIIEDEDQWQLLSNKIWDMRAEQYANMGIVCTGLQCIVYLMYTMEHHFFQKEFQNNPIQLGGHIQWEWLKWYDKKDPISTHGRWVIFVDIATSESKESESYTSMACVGNEYGTQDYFLHDLRVGKWPALAKYREIAHFAKEMSERLAYHVPVIIEVVRNQAEAYQALRDAYPDLTVKGANPKGRGDKEWRIKEGLVLEMGRGHLHVNKYVTHLSQFKSECDTFPHMHPEILDAVDQAVYHLKVAKKSFPKSGRTSSKFRARTPR